MPDFLDLYLSAGPGSPIMNSWTLTPKARAAKKCPPSWSRTRMEKVTTPQKMAAIPVGILASRLISGGSFPGPTSSAPRPRHGGSGGLRRARAEPCGVAPSAGLLPRRAPRERACRGVDGLELIERLHRLARVRLHRGGHDPFDAGERQRAG